MRKKKENDLIPSAVWSWASSPCKNKQHLICVVVRGHFIDPLVGGF
jgi:hypothetical protein